MKKGVVYTPIKIVKYMLNRINYKNSNILQKHIIDNSCGEGAFLIEVVTRYIIEYQNKNKNLLGIEKQLEKYIHGIELSLESYEKTIKNLNNLIFKYNIKKVIWNILNADSTKIEVFNNKMDFVVGNPPYIRIHDLDKKNNHNFSLAKKGMTDLYIIFFQISINMLNDKGQIIYITPNSFFNSKAGYEFRKYILVNNLLREIINLGHYNPFKNVTTYTAITYLDKSKINTKSFFYKYDGENTFNKIKYNNYDFFINNIFYFNTLEMIKIFKEITNMKIDKRSGISVKNGISTNLDYFFINDNWKGTFVKDVYKISTGSYSKIIFPYDDDAKLINFNNLDAANIKKFNTNKEKLSKRDLRGQKWYAFARTQGIKDTFKKRICINSVIKNLDSIKLKIIEKNILVYSGYYINYNYEYEEKIIKVIMNEKFINYIKSLNKEKNGKYFFFSSKDLEKYLIWNLKE